MKEVLSIESGVSVICATNKVSEFKNILENFLRQNYDPKELIIILNMDIDDIDNLKNMVEPYPNIEIYNLGSKLTLGECLNFAIERSKYPIIAKFDDDDYYSHNYLCDTYQSLSIENVGIVGKSCIYIYFAEKKKIGIRYPNKENKFVNRVTGSTLMFKKELFNKIRFKPMNLGEDIEFCKDCLKLGYKIYSTNKCHYVYIRNNKDSHTWKMDNDYILNQCSKVYETNNFKEYICNSVN